MTHTFFRREVIEASRGTWLGVVNLAQPTSVWMLTGAAMAVTLVVAIFLSCGQYARRTTVQGQLVPVSGMVTVVAPATGLISDLKVAEGSRVAEGAQLAVVAIPSATPAGGSTQQALELKLRQRQEGVEKAAAAQQSQLDAEANGLRRQLESVQAELAQTEQEVLTRRQQATIAMEMLQRLRRLEGTQYVSVLQIRQQETLMLDYQSQVQELQRQALQARRSIAQLQQSLLALPGEQSQAMGVLQRDLAQIDQERVQVQAQGALSVEAPVPGVVSVGMVKSGQAVLQGQPLLSLLPGDGILQADLWVPSRAIGFIAKGDRVLLRYQAFPYQKFGHQEGWVVSVSRSTLEPGMAKLAQPSEMREPLYRVSVALPAQTVRAYGNDEPLKPGMLLEADVLGESRSLVEWAFEPLYSIRGRFGQ